MLLGTRAILFADQSTTIGTLLDGIFYNILLDSGATRSFMSKQYDLRNKLLHCLSKFISKNKIIQVGNGTSAII